MATSTGNILSDIHAAVGAHPIAILVDGYKLDRVGVKAPETMVKFAKSVGRIDRCALFTTAGGREDGWSASTWSANGFQVLKQTTKKSTVSIPLITEAIETATLKPFVKVMVVVAVDCSLYEELFSTLTRLGVTVIAANFSTTPKNAGWDPQRILYTTVKDLESVESVLPQVAPQNLENYDFSEFIQLMVASEDKMPFVGVRFFINKVMWRLGNTDPQICQEVFHQAEELGIIELYKSTNINEGSPDVSACRLDRENQTVRAAIGLPLPGSPEEGGIIDVSTETSSVTVYVGTKTPESVDSDTALPPTEDRPNV